METKQSSDFPQIVSYKEMSLLTRKSYSTVARWASHKDFRPGIYMGRGMFNLTQFNYWIQKKGNFLTDKKN